jgi:16S rRNA processing protein RimM
MEIIYTGSNDVYVVQQGAAEVLVPALRDVVRTIDTQRGEVHLFATPGLFD